MLCWQEVSGTAAQRAVLCKPEEKNTKQSGFMNYEWPKEPLWGKSVTPLALEEKKTHMVNKLSDAE